MRFIGELVVRSYLTGNVNEQTATVHAKERKTSPLETPSLYTHILVLPYTPLNHGHLQRPCGKLVSGCEIEALITWAHSLWKSKPF
jgi:hypothetical protein